MDDHLAASLHRQPFLKSAVNDSVQAWLGSTRPLSDIREITEPSLGGGSVRGSIHRIAVPSQLPQPPAKTDIQQGQGQSQPTLRYPRPESRQGRSVRKRSGSIKRTSPLRTPQPADHEDIRGQSPHSIPREAVPPRSSSRPRRPSDATVRQAPHLIVPSSPEQHRRIINKCHSESPVKEVVSRIDPKHAERALRIPSKTIVKGVASPSNDILEFPFHPHPRIKLEVQLAAPLFVGGSSVEGSIRVTVDEADRVRHRKALVLERATVDLLGVEEVSGPRRYVFLALRNELVDADHPPPADMAQSQLPSLGLHKSWILVPSSSNLPFLITLPLEVGPPPFKSKYARIRYIVCATLTVKDAGRQLAVRMTQETAILSVYDPEKALVSLQSPLTAVDEWVRYRPHGVENIVATAGLHRQVWVSGTSIFADVHIKNSSRKTVKKLKMQLERIVLCYRHAAASTIEMSASQARLFDHIKRSIVGKSVIKPGRYGWGGVDPGDSDTRTCSLELPRDNATVKCNKYFEVRYYLNVVVGTSHHKLATVQLPIILIHMNSLDVPTNSVAQVAAAIEEKRGGRRLTVDHRGSPRPRSNPASRTMQSRAFAAPRFRSNERRQAHLHEMEELGRVLDTSPRKHRPAKKPSVGNMSFTFKTPPSNRKGRVIDRDALNALRMKLQPMPSPGAGRGNLAESQPSPDGVYERPRASSALDTYPAGLEHKAPSRLGSMLSLRAPSKLSLDLTRPKRTFERWKPPWKMI